VQPALVGGISECAHAEYWPCAAKGGVKGCGCCLHAYEVDSHTVRRDTVKVMGDGCAYMPLRRIVTFWIQGPAYREMVCLNAFGVQCQTAYESSMVGCGCATSDGSCGCAEGVLTVWWDAAVLTVWWDVGVLLISWDVACDSADTAACRCILNLGVPASSPKLSMQLQAAVSADSPMLVWAEAVNATLM
jgi:hypothetical protein